MRKIRWGVMGTANIGAGCTIPGMQQADNCELYAIAGRNMEKQSSLKKSIIFKKLTEAMRNCLRIRKWKQCTFHFQILCIMSGRSGH